MVTLIYLSQMYSYYIRGDMSPLMLAACKFEAHGLVPRSDIKVSKKDIFLIRSLVDIQYCGEPP